MDDSDAAAGAPDLGRAVSIIPPLPGEPEFPGPGDVRTGDVLPPGPALLRVSFGVMERYDAVAAEHGLTAQQARLLYVLLRRPRNMIGLGAALRLPKSTTTGVIARMEAAGLVERTPDPADRRNLITRLTPAGETTAIAVVEAIRDVVAELLADVPDRDRDELARVLTGVGERADALAARTPVLRSE
jgi:DNA-binding MarR family transcriptional regulator